MAEVDSRYIAFENDHAYLKTTDGYNEDTHLLQNNICTIKSEIDESENTSAETQNTVNIDNIIPKSVNSIHLQNSNVFFLSDSSNLPHQSSITMPLDNLPVQTFIIENKSSIRPVQPKVKKNSIKSFAPQTQPNISLIPSENTNLQNMILKPNEPQDKPVTKCIKPMKNKISKDNENGIRTINLSPNLLKRIQSGENLYMCMDCDKIYTKHKDLLDHQMIHEKYDTKIMDQEEIRKNLTVNNNYVIENEEQFNGNNYYAEKTKYVSKSSVNSKKQKVIFQGECILCHSVFPDLDIHIRTVHHNDLNKANQSSYECYKCESKPKFDCKQQLRAHEFFVHNRDHAYTCEHCFKNFVIKEDLEMHLETHYSDIKKYLCPYCDVGFPHANGLKTHLVKHFAFYSLENSTLEIPTSRIEYSPVRPSEQLDPLFEGLNNISKDDNEVYFEQVSNDNYVHKFKTEDDILSPLDSIMTEDQNFGLELKKIPLDDNKNKSNQQPKALMNKKRISYTVCRICMIIVSYSRIGKHMKKKHNSAAPYQCEVCYAEFNRKHVMDDHRRKHTNNKPHKCIECSKCFTYKHHLNRHRMIVHRGDSLEKSFKCSKCDKAFSFKEYLSLHINSRHRGKHYMCQTCGKKFSTNAALNKHQLCHTDERPFMCEHCGRTFKCKTHCDTHKKNMHPGDPELALPPEKFECNLCNKKFSTKVYRDMHLKRHNGQGHQCDLCSKLFVSKAHLHRHMRIMHPN